MPNVPECEKVAVLDDEITKVKCPHCNFEADYEKYLGDYEREGTKHVGRLYSRQTRFLDNKLQRLISGLTIFSIAWLTSR